jgi:hypothetical protein
MNRLVPLIKVMVYQFLNEAKTRQEELVLESIPAPTINFDYIKLSKKAQERFDNHPDLKINFVKASSPEFVNDHDKGGIICSLHKKISIHDFRNIPPDSDFDLIMYLHLIAHKLLLSTKLTSNRRHIITSESLWSAEIYAVAASFAMLVLLKKQISVNERTIFLSMLSSIFYTIESEISDHILKLVSSAVVDLLVPEGSV